MQVIPVFPGGDGDGDTVAKEGIAGGGCERGQDTVVERNKASVTRAPGNKRPRRTLAKIASGEAPATASPTTCPNRHLIPLQENSKTTHSQPHVQDNQVSPALACQPHRKGLPSRATLRGLTPAVASIAASTIVAAVGRDRRSAAITATAAAKPLTCLRHGKARLGHEP